MRYGHDFWTRNTRTMMRLLCGYEKRQSSPAPAAPENVSDMPKRFPGDLMAISSCASGAGAFAIRATRVCRSSACSRARHMHHRAASHAANLPLSWSSALAANRQAPDTAPQHRPLVTHCRSPRRRAVAFRPEKLTYVRPLRTNSSYRTPVLKEIDTGSAILDIMLLTE